MELWFLLSVTVAFFWGTSGIFAKSSSPVLGVARVALLIAGVEGIMYLMAYIAWRQPVDISLSDGALAAGSCLVGITGYLCYFESLVDGKVSIAGTISAAYPVLTVLGAVIILSETLTAAHALGVVAIIAGVLGLSYERGPLANSASSRRSLVFALLAFFLWGVWSLSSKVAVEAVTAGNLFGFYILSSLTAPLIYAWIRSARPVGKTFENPTRIAWIFGAAALALNVFGAFAFTFALEQGNASLVVPISSAYPLVTVVFAMTLLRETLDKAQIAALACVVAGLVLIGVTV